LAREGGLTEHTFFGVHTGLLVSKPTHTNPVHMAIAGSTGAATYIAREGCRSKFALILWEILWF
ncbi:hypothetical protein RYA99_20340, partial [Pseudomonas syringae pv. actinidifoliorum]|nr:hypothetical protein [Pseudomonas syringae pv. actinidifoliorum]